MKIRITLALAALLMQGAAVSAAEIKVLCTGGIRPPIEELVPQFERTSGHKVAITFMGGPAVKQQIDGGAAFDVAVAAANVIDELAKAAAWPRPLSVCGEAAFVDLDHNGRLGHALTRQCALVAVEQLRAQPLLRRRLQRHRQEP